MNKLNPHLKALTEIIMIYANIPPAPIENLRLLKEALLAPSFDDGSGQCKIWGSSVVPSSLDPRIETIIGVHNLGLEKAKIIFDNPENIDKFNFDIISNYFWGMCGDERREFFDSAFHEVYGYSNEGGRCPCSWGKMKALAEKGFVTANEDDYEKATWINKRLNCLECDHLYFVTILENIAMGKYGLLSESEIVAKYRKTSLEEVVFWSEKQPLGKLIFAYGYEENDAAWPRYLNGLPCNVLVDLLSSGPYAKKIKRCPICRDFFFAKKTDRILSSDKEECNKKLKTHRKCYQREKDPIKYGSSKPKEGNIDEYNRLKAIWDNNVK